MSKPPLPPPSAPMNLPPIPFLGVIGAPRKPNPEHPVHDRATLLRCRASSAAVMAAHYAEEALKYAAEAAEADPKNPWRLGDPCAFPDGDGLPDDWFDLADFPLPAVETLR